MNFKLAMSWIAAALTLSCLAFAWLALGAVSVGAQTPNVKLIWGYTNPSSYYWDVYAAIDLGFMKKEGLDVDEVETSSSGQGVQVLMGSAVDVCSCNVELAVTAAAKGADIALVGGETNRASFALIARPEFKSYADLKGKLLGVTQMKEASTTMLRLLLAKHGITKGEYDLITVGGTPSRFAALKTGAIAATMLSQPVDFQAETQGMHKLGYAFEAFNGPIIGFAASRSWAQKNSDRLVRFLRATAEASRWLSDIKNRDRAIAILVKRTKSSPSDAQKNYDLWYGPDQIMARHLELPLAGVQAYLTLDELQGPPSKYVDMSYADKALQGVK